MPVRAVLFDLGSTLWHIPSRPPVDLIRKETVRRISDLLRSWGIEPEGELFYLGRDIRLAITELDQRAYDDHCVSPDYVAIVRDVAKAKGLDLDDERSRALWHAWNLDGEFFGRVLFEDALETLETLRDWGYRIGCVTNRPFGGPAFFQELEAHGLTPLFEALSLSCDVGYMKPHPRIYEHALEALDVRPADAVMVGDSLRADVAGAQALGMTAVWRTHPERTYEDKDVDHVRPDYVVGELREILDLACFAHEGRAAAR